MSGLELIDRLDHLVLAVRDIESSLRFYERALGLRPITFHTPQGELRHALRFGRHKINLQDAATQTPTKASVPTPGAGDFCLIAAVPLEQVIAHLQAEAIAIEAGPVPRHGALGALRSIYFRDPDGNLVEVAEYV